MIIFIIVDLFCGAGGVTQGFEEAEVEGVEFIVLAGVNHDEKAIESHAANHPNTKHFIEDVTDPDVVVKVAILVMSEKARLEALGHTVYILLHASLECTSFSNAKGGGSRDADSRALADSMPVWIVALDPDFFSIENVREFMSWGPLRIKGKTFTNHSELVMRLNKKKKQWEYVFVPESRKKGQDYVRWVNEVEMMGYVYSKRLLNSADFGAHTSRIRLFGLFSRTGIDAWPEPTHSRTPEKNAVFGKIPLRWKPVRECLDLKDKGRSIFGRKKPLAPKSLGRICAGLMKHVAKGEAEFIVKHYSSDNPGTMCISLKVPAGAMTTSDSHSLVTAEPFIVKALGNNEKTGINNGKSIDECGIAITTQVRQSLVTPEPYIVQSNGGKVEAKSYGLDRPARVITSADNQSLVTPFLMSNYSGNDAARNKSLEEPSSTLTTCTRHAVVTPEAFLMTYYSGSDENRVKSLEEACLVITTENRHAIVTPVAAESEGFLIKYHGSEKEGHSIDKPSGALTTKDGAALIQHNYLLTMQHDNVPKALDEPSPALLTGNHHYLITTHHGGQTHSVDKSSPTIIARQDKSPIYLAGTEYGYSPHWNIQPGDCEEMIRIRMFMRAYNIADIFMRMLKVPELLPIQGFPRTYILKGSDTHKKKFIGNSVPPVMSKVIGESLGRAVLN